MVCFSSLLGILPRKIPAVRLGKFSTDLIGFISDKILFGLTMNCGCKTQAKSWAQPKVRTHLVKEK